MLPVPMQIRMNGISLVIGKIHWRIELTLMQKIRKLVLSGSGTGTCSRGVLAKWRRHYGEPKRLSGKSSSKWINLRFGRQRKSNFVFWVSNISTNDMFLPICFACVNAPYCLKNHPSIVYCAVRDDVITMTPLTINNRQSVNGLICVLETSTTKHFIRSLGTRVFYVPLQRPFIYLFGMNRATFPVISRLTVTSSTWCYFNISAAYCFAIWRLLRLLASHNIHNWSVICHLICLSFYESVGIGPICDNKEPQ